MNLPQQHVLLLGEVFMRVARDQLDYAAGTCTLQQGRKSICRKCSADITQPPDVQAAVHALRNPSSWA